MYHYDTTKIKYVLILLYFLGGENVFVKFRLLYTLVIRHVNFYHENAFSSSALL